MLRLRIALISLILLALMTLLWAWSTRVANGAAIEWVALMPGMAARQQAASACPQRMTFMPQRFRVTTTRWIEGKAMVFYTAECRDGINAPVTLTGDVFVAWTWMGWQVESSSAGTGSGGSGQNPLEGLGMSQSVGADPYTIVRGTVGIPDVVLVEVVLSDGEVVQDQPTNGVFVAYIPQAIEVREIRLLNDAGQLLHQMDIPQPPAPPQPGAPPPSGPLP